MSRRQAVKLERALSVKRSGPPARYPATPSRLTAASTISGVIRVMQRWSIGQERRKHGEHVTGERTTLRSAPNGDV